MAIVLPWALSEAMGGYCSAREAFGQLHQPASSTAHAVKLFSLPSLRIWRSHHVVAAKICDKLTERICTSLSRIVVAPQFMDVQYDTLTGQARCVYGVHSG